MSAQSPADTISRLVGSTEYSWCKAVPGGTGITVLSLLFSKQPNLSHLQSCIHKLQTSHPILRSKLRFNPSTNAFSIVTSTGAPAFQIHTSELAQSFYLTIEHEMRTNPWRNCNQTDKETDLDVMFASCYSLPDQQWAVVLRLHTAVCDRAAAAFLLRELLGLFCDGELGVDRQIVEEKGLGLAIEDCIPSGKANKPFWIRGADMIGYSMQGRLKDFGGPKQNIM